MVFELGGSCYQLASLQLELTCPDTYEILNGQFLNDEGNLRENHKYSVQKPQ
jgi:hypothetical protein